MLPAIRKASGENTFPPKVGVLGFTSVLPRDRVFCFGRRTFWFIVVPRVAVQTRVLSRRHIFSFVQESVKTKVYFTTI